jgi:hypothetical protein
MPPLDGSGALELSDSLADEFVDVVVGEEVGLVGWVSADRGDPGAVRSLGVELAEVVSPGAEALVVLVSVVVPAADTGVILIGAAVLVPFDDVIDL